MTESTASLDEIYNILIKETCVPLSQIKPDSDLERDLQITGDDFAEVIEKITSQFKIDMKEYHWYFHHSEEPIFNPGSFLFKTPDSRVSHIPVTPNILLEAANTRKWPIQYPPHKLPLHRYDVFITWGLFVVFSLCLLYLKFIA